MSSSFSELVKSRRSIRSYLLQKVPRETIIQCIEAARWAPSAENAQPWRFIVIDDEQVKKNFCKQAFSGIYSFSKWAEKAPVIIVISAQLNIITHRMGKQIQGTNYHLIDIGIAGEHLVLQAKELGLGTCWIGWFNAKKAKKFFKLPSSYRVVALISMGYPDEKSPRSKKKFMLDDILWFNEFKKRPT